MGKVTFLSAFLSCWPTNAIRAGVTDVAQAHCGLAWNVPVAIIRKILCLHDLVLRYSSVYPV